MAIRILHPESVTRLDPYLDRARRVDDFQAHVDLALVLVLREDEFFRLHVRYQGNGFRLDSSIPADLWEPHPFTADARHWLEQDMTTGVGSAAGPGSIGPRDLFGLKRDVAGGLERALRRSRRPLNRELPLLFKLWRDLLRFQRTAIEAREWAVRAPDDPVPLAYLHESALLASGAEDPEWLEYALAVDERGRRLLAGRDGGDRLMWSAHIIQRLDEALTDRANAVRKRHEPGFARFLTTERKFYEAERAAALQGFDENDIPPDLRSLAPLARSLGVGDDPGRAFFVARTGKAGREKARAAIQANAGAIDRWLAGFDQSRELPPTQRAFFWLRAVGEEL